MPYRNATAHDSHKASQHTKGADISLSLSLLMLLLSYYCSSSLYIYNYRLGVVAAQGRHHHGGLLYLDLRAGELARELLVQLRGVNLLFVVLPHGLEGVQLALRLV